MRRIAALGLLAGLASGAVGCGRAGATAPAPAPGEPLGIRDAAPAARAACPTCGAATGPDHRCGRSRPCAGCAAERAGDGAAHVCGVSRFCPDCGREAAIAGHQCRTSAFCKGCLADVESDHVHPADGR